MLIARDEQSCLVVSYREIKSCVESAFRCIISSRITYASSRPYSASSPTPGRRYDSIEWSQNIERSRNVSQLQTVRTRKRLVKAIKTSILPPRLLCVECSLGLRRKRMSR